MTKLNEMGDYAPADLASSAPPEMTVELPMATIGGDSAIASVETTTPTEIDPDSVNVYALGVTNASTSEGNILAFDVNFSVSFTYTYDDQNKPVTKTGDLVFTNGPDAGRHFQTGSLFSYYPLTD